MDKRKRRLLCMLEGSGQKSRWISGVPPLSFKAKKAGTLENYRIYGNTVGGESVGDLVTSGQHAGEYVVPVTVEGKNLLQNTATSQEINGVTFTVNSDGSVICNGTATERIGFQINRTMLQSGDYNCSNNIQGSPTSYYVDWNIRAASSTTLKEYSQAIKITTDEAVNVTAWINIVSGYNCNNITFSPMIRKADITDDTYEPYRTPVTTPIYLPEQVKKVGDEAEYIDYAEQKMHRIGADDVDVTLPALPTLPGTNVLSVGTAVQPSKIEVKGKIKAI